MKYVKELQTELMENKNSYTVGALVEFAEE